MTNVPPPSLSYVSREEPHTSKYIHLEREIVFVNKSGYLPTGIFVQFNSQSRHHGQFTILEFSLRAPWRSVALPRYKINKFAEHLSDSIYNNEWQRLSYIVPPNHQLCSTTYETHTDNLFTFQFIHLYGPSHPLFSIHNLRFCWCCDGRSNDGE